MLEKWPESAPKRILRPLLLLAAVMGLVWSTFFLTGAVAPASASPFAQDVLCGDGSAPDYGFRENLQQEHWTVGWQGYVSQDTVNEIDTILDRLEADSIAQTMILIRPQSRVGNRVNCAVHFLRYMQLGLPSGERKDNGFVFLVVIEPDKIDIHYGVGLGLPALTAAGLTPLNRAGEETYRSSGGDLDKALLTLVQDYDAYTRSKYPPLVSAPDSYTATLDTVQLPPLPEGPLGVLTVCGLLCIGTIILIFVIWLLIQMSRMGIRFSPPSGGGSSWTRGGFGGGGFGGGGGGPRMRGGGGSGRSGRGN